MSHRIIGVDHAELGARLAERWNLPRKLVGAIGGHHDQTRCTDDESKVWAANLCVADYICTACGIQSQPGPPGRVSPETWEQAGLASQDVPPLLDVFFRDLPTVDELVNAARA